MKYIKPMPPYQPDYKIGKTYKILGILTILAFLLRFTIMK